MFSSLAVMKRRGESIYFEVCLLCSTVERDRMDERHPGGERERERQRERICVSDVFFSLRSDDSSRRVLDMRLIRVID